MTIDKIKEKITNLSTRINDINAWIKNNPQVTEPNVYEIMDCNVTYAELVAELIAYYNKNGWISTFEEKNPETSQETRKQQVVELLHLHPTLASCSFDLHAMEALHNFSTHPYIQQKEAKAIYYTVKIGQLNGTYILPETEDDRRIKKELICKAMSVPFYIWQAKQIEPDYKYNNENEFNAMKEMLTLYQASENPCQFKEQVSGMFAKIEEDYKYSTQKVDTSANKK